MLLDFIFPKRCLECKRNGKYICDICINKVSPCGTIGDNYSIFKYQGVIRKALIELKYKFATDIADELINNCVDRININFPVDSMLIPIPLHKKRENWRGFNQAEVLGEKLAKKMNWKYESNLLIRYKNTIPQVGLKGSVRRNNLSGVFSVNTDHFISNNCSLVLFDDVYTTGTTINEAKKTLKNAGFERIYSLTVAN